MKTHSSILLLAALLCLAMPGFSQVPHLLHHQGRVAVDGVNFNGSGEFKFALVDAGTNVSRQATAIATISNGYVTGVAVSDGGAGYTSAPTVVMKDIKAGGTGAVLQCTAADGAVTAITVQNPGSGYTTLASVQIDAPPPSIVYQTWWGNAPDTTPADGQPDAAVTLAVANGLFDVLLGDSTLANMAAVPASVFSNPDVRLRVWFDDSTHGFQQLTPDKRIAAVGYAVIAENVPDGAITAGKIATGAVGSTQLATGAVTSGKLATGAVQSSNVAVGAITSTQLAANAVQAANIAPGTITATQLAKPPRSGSIASSSLQFDFSTATFAVPFSPAFVGNPMVTLGFQGALPAGGAPSLWVESASPSSFTGRFSVPFEPERIGGNWEYSTPMVIVDGNPAVAYAGTGSTTNYINFKRSNDAGGTDWDSAELISSQAAGDCSLAVINGNPAICYYSDYSYDLIYRRATDASGTAWGSYVTVAGDGIGPNNVGRSCSLAEVNGFPAISYYDVTTNQLKFVRATTSSGSAWGTPITIDSTDYPGSRFISLAMVNGNPAILYEYTISGTSKQARKFVRATNANGSSWGTPVVGPVVEYPSPMVIVNGKPAYSFFNSSASTFYYQRASDANGAAWDPEISVMYGNGGYYGSLAVVHDKPAISCLGHTGLLYLNSTDVNGTAWNPPTLLLAESTVGSTSLKQVNGYPAISYPEDGTNNLMFLRAPLPASFTIQWIALEP